MKQLRIYVAIIDLIHFLYWQWLVLDAKTCAEMPQIKEYKRKLADKHKHW